MMHKEIEEACKQLGLELPMLRKASERSQNTLSDARSYLQKEVPPKDVPIDVVALGSLARHEVTPNSDLDYVVIVHSLLSSDKISLTRKLLSAADSVRDKLELKEPGGYRYVRCCYFCS